MTERQFEDFLRDAARDLNAPGETPREEIWSRIQAARRVGWEGREGRNGRKGQERRMGRWWPVAPVVRWGLAAAAILALGIGIGMNLDRASGDGSTVGAMAETDPTGGGTDDVVYRMAALEHLGRTEAFLTMFRADVRAGRGDYRVSSPVRDLLTTTRLLKGSPAAEDRRMAELLEDLELMLMQIALLRAEVDGEEADLVARGMDEKGVLLKLRAAAPAGPALRGIQGVL